MLQTRPSARWILAGLLAAVLAFMALPAYAQDDGSSGEPETVAASDEQARLNDQGVRAIGKGDYVKAISLLEEALYLGKLNITYLNLGRAYQKAGRCEKARATLQKVPTAPAVKKPPAGFIEAKAEEYLAELEEDCEFDDEQADAETEDEPDDGGDEKDTVAEQEDKGTDADTESAEESVEPPPSTSNATGIALTGAGAVMILGATSMHFLWAEPTRADITEGIEPGDRVSNVSQQDYFEARDRANRIDTAALTMGIAGAAVTGLGVYFLISDSGSERASSLRLSPSRDGVRATWTVRF